MTPATRTTGPRPGLFAHQLHRAAAQRGRLDPVYQELSDHWTAILQRLYPVWALIGPGLSDPGHIEIHSRTVYLDSRCLHAGCKRSRSKPQPDESPTALAADGQRNYSSAASRAPTWRLPG